MKKVLHLLSSNQYSGAENVACQIIEAFRNDIEMVYCSPNGPISNILKSKNVNYLPLDNLSFKEVKEIIKTFRPDLIHAHDIKASLIAAHCSKNIPVISHLHGRFEDMSKISVKSLLYRTYIKKFSHIFAVSESIIKEYYFSNALSNKSSVLYNVVNQEKLVNMVSVEEKETEFDCVYLGRFSYPKNPQRLIYIISKVVEKIPNSTFVLIGDGDLLDEAKKLAEKLKVQKNILFKGFLNNPYQLVSASKVMILTSRSEGTPMCVLESMLLGVPIVSTAVDGIKELIENKVDGFYYEKDENIVNAICKLITDEQLRNSVSKNAYNKAIKINNIDNYKSHILNVYSNNILIDNLR
ncbi:glycosyltransferase [Peribacillus simplex]|uniref:glycosyltransferase n=1 Tax=Peribacillus simplex TaxID=1478 RepID=UPI003D2D8077